MPQSQSHRRLSNHGRCTRVACSLKRGFAQPLGHAAGFHVAFVVTVRQQNAAADPAKNGFSFQQQMVTRSMSQPLMELWQRELAGRSLTHQHGYVDGMVTDCFPTLSLTRIASLTTRTGVPYVTDVDVKGTRTSTGPHAAFGSMCEPWAHGVVVLPATAIRPGARCEPSFLCSYRRRYELPVKRPARGWNSGS